MGTERITPLLNFIPIIDIPQVNNTISVIWDIEGLNDNKTLINLTSIKRDLVGLSLLDSPVYLCFLDECFIDIYGI